MTAGQVQQVRLMLTQVSSQTETLVLLVLATPTWVYGLTLVTANGTLPMSMTQYPQGQSTRQTQVMSKVH